MTRAGFVGVIGRPNAGKSTLLNWLVGERLALVSHKANATRKRLQCIVMHGESQIIFVDTPGIHAREKLLNQFMMQEVLKAIGECDFLLFLHPMGDSLEHYEEFLALNVKNTPHAVLLSKCDTGTQEEQLAMMERFAPFQERFSALIPVSAAKNRGKEALLECASNHLPPSPYLYDPEDLTTETVRAIYKELIREAVFEKSSDEVPYESDILIEKIEEGERLDRVFATIVVEKDSQKMILIGKGGEAIKRIGTHARIAMEEFANKKIFLQLHVSVKKGWSKTPEALGALGYHFT